MNRLILLILSTFFLGLCFGFFVYLMGGNIGSQLPEDPTPANNDLTFEIIADAYGGCARTGPDNCPSYQIRDDGSYTYVAPAEVGEERQFTGHLAAKDVSDLRTRLRDANLPRLTSTRFSGTCPIAYDGLAYKFEIRYEGQRYKFDTCTQDITDTRLGERLIEYFTAFASVNLPQ
jgi:hypothetical protein